MSSTFGSIYRVSTFENPWGGNRRWMSANLKF